MIRKSAGILAYRIVDGFTEVLLVHPGGPIFLQKYLGVWSDLGTWSIPKGEFENWEEPLIAAKRGFEEELGMNIDGKFIKLSPVRQKNGKIVFAYAIEAAIDVAHLISNTFAME